MLRLLRKDAPWLEPADEALAAPSVAPGWALDALRGRLVEISAGDAGAVLTVAVGLVLEAQLAGEPAAWMPLGDGGFYLPDVVASGVDLAALVIVRVADATAGARAAELLLRSGGFGLAVLDLVGLVGSAAELPVAHQGRLVGLAQAHDAAVVCLTSKPADAPSLGSLVSLRAEAVRRSGERPGGRDGHRVDLRVVKDKRRGPGWSHAIALRGPEGWLDVEGA